MSTPSPVTDIPENFLKERCNVEKFSASRAERLMNCSASGNLEVAIPNWTPPVEDPNADTAANRGTHMHELLAKLNELTAGEFVKFVQALNYIAELRSKRRFNVLIEQTEMATWLKDPVPTTADLVLYTADEMHIVDFKWGRIPVEVTDNEQLLYYAATYGKYAPKAKQITVHIVQPNAEIYEEWVIDTSTLLAFMVKGIQVQDNLLAGRVSFMPGDHCTFCPANPHSRAAKGSPLCPAMMQLLYPAPFDEDEILKEDS